MAGEITTFEAVVAEVSPDLIAILIPRAIGAISGAALALVFVPPRTFRGFVRRGSASMLTGLIFAGYIQIWLDFSKDNDGAIGASCLTAFISWSAMGALKRITETWQPKALQDE